MPRLANGRYEIFCYEYIKNFNGAEAARAAGYAVRTARTKANKLLTRADISGRVNELKAERLERLQIDSDYVLYRLHSIDVMDVTDIVEDDGSFKPIDKWPAIWRQMISGLDISETWQGAGDDKKIAGLLKKIKWPDKLKNLEMMGKHISVQAFKDTQDLNLGLRAADMLNEIARSVDGTSKGLPGA